MVFMSAKVMSQITKSEVQAFILAHPTNAAQKIFVTKKVDYSPSANDFAQANINFDAATTVLIAKESSLVIKDGTGVEVYVPYLSIRCLAYNPETDKKYESIQILIQ